VTKASAGAAAPRFGVVVIGAGAAGMMCAAVAGRRGRRVLLIEHYDKLGEKIRISGGGRCNFTNLHASPANYLSQNPDFCRSALSRYTPRDFIELVERYRIAWHEKTLGQLFCDKTSLDVVALLKTECDRAGVQWRMPCAVQGVTHEGGVFAVSTSMGLVHGEALVIATGGLTVPKIGATQSSSALLSCRRVLRWCRLRSIRQRWHAMATSRVCRSTPKYRATTAGSARRCCLPIAAFPARRFFRSPRTGTAATGCRSICCRATMRRRGWKASAGRRRDWTTFLHGVCRGASRSSGASRTTLPSRSTSSTTGAGESWPACSMLGRCSRRARSATTRPKSRSVASRALSSRTMAATRVPRLHFIGEVVDVTGWLGGYNFQWAWSSGYAAGQHA